MEYETFQPNPDLDLFVNCYWTLVVPASDAPVKQRIIPDGLVEMAFILGEDIKRYTSEEEFIIQPRAMFLGQTMEPFYIEPTGYVNTFSVRFYPYGFAQLAKSDLNVFANKETPLAEIFDQSEVDELQTKIVNASNTIQRIEIVEEWIQKKMPSKIEIDGLVQSTLDAMIESFGSKSIRTILSDKPSLRRRLERKFMRYIGVSPKQMGKVIRFQAALKFMLNQEPENLTEIAHRFQYFDQAHFIKDFKDFTGIIPKELLMNQNMKLSSLFYK